MVVGVVLLQKVEKWIQLRGIERNIYTLGRGSLC
jgi:hypothetical protein